MGLKITHKIDSGVRIFGIPDNSGLVCLDLIYRGGEYDNGSIFRFDLFQKDNLKASFKNARLEDSFIVQFKKPKEFRGINIVVDEFNGAYTEIGTIYSAEAHWYIQNAKYPENGFFLPNSASRYLDNCKKIVEKLPHLAPQLQYVEDLARLQRRKKLEAKNI